MSTSLRVWYSAVLAVGAGAIVAGGVLAQPTQITAAGAPVPTQAGVALMSANPTVSMKVQAGATQQWVTKFMPALGRVNDSIKSLQAAAEGQDFGAMQASCSRLSKAAGDIEAMLPAPRRDMTTALQSAVDSYQQVGAKCDTLTPEGGQAAVQAISVDVKNGMTAMDQATTIYKNAAGPG
ncbi:hypothetical protein QN239_05980 [Mycolicibacterium sp. Y3]